MPPAANFLQPRYLSGEQTGDLYFGSGHQRGWGSVIYAQRTPGLLGAVALTKVNVQGLKL